MQAPAPTHPQVRKTSMRSAAHELRRAAGYQDWVSTCAQLNKRLRLTLEKLGARGLPPGWHSPKSAPCELAGNTRQGWVFAWAQPNKCFTRTL